MIKKAEIMYAQCDYCAASPSHENGVIAEVDIEDLNEALENAGWHTEGEKHYCPDCAHKLMHKPYKIE